MSLEDVRHASPPREMSGSQTALAVVVQAAEVPEVVKKRMFKGPLGSYALHHDRIAFNFEAERERLDQDIAQVFALRTRYEWLKRLVDHVHEKKTEKSPEIEAEWCAVRELKTKLQESHNRSRMDAIAADAATVLPVWQTPVRVPENLKTRCDRVQALEDVQSLISDAAVKRLAEFKSLEDKQKIVQEQRNAIRLLERAIQEKLRQLPTATYERNDFSCLKEPCCVDKVRYPNSDDFVETVAKYYRSAESIWKEVKGTLDEVRGKMAEWAEKVQKNANFRFSNELQEYKVNLGQSELVLAETLEVCRKQCAVAIKGKADYLASLGLGAPEVKKWVERAQEEVDKRLDLLLFELKDLRGENNVLDQFQQRLDGYVAESKVAKKASATPPPAAVETSKGRSVKVFSLFSTGRSSPAVYACPPAIQWLKVQPVKEQHCLTVLLPDQDRIRQMMPPQEHCRDLSKIPEVKWTLVDRWKNCLEVVLPRVIHLLNDLVEFNRSLSRLQQRSALLELLFKGKNSRMEAAFGQQPWIAGLIAELQQKASSLSQRREEIRQKQTEVMPILHTLISEMERVLQVGKQLTTSAEIVDEKARKLQESMAEAMHELTLIEGLAVTEWSAGEGVNKIQTLLEQYPANRFEKILSPQPLDSQAGVETQALNVSNAFSEIMAAKDGPERAAKLDALEAEGARKERLKLDGLARKFREESERLDGLMEHVLTIYANWAHLDDMAKGIKNSRPIPPTVLISPLIELVRGWNTWKSDVVEYAPFITDVLKNLRLRVLWLEEKLTPEKRRWREDQESFLMRTAEGNLERNRQLEQEIGKYTLAIAALETFWKAGEEKYRSFVASLNEVHERKEGRKGTLISETPYQIEVKAPSAPAPAAAPAEKVDLKDNWTNFDDQSVIDIQFSLPFAFGGPSQAVPPVPAAVEVGAAVPAPVKAHAEAPSEDLMSLSALQALEQMAKEASQTGTAAQVALPSLQPTSSPDVVPLNLKDKDNP
ncbi:MAG: hypothetical protein LLG04_14230 [Parachlamydia sp.]|nr:hypothetical protein [Parachlamydia sp.]